MPNRNYEKGRRFEYKVKKFYEKYGYTVVRASGSHSPYDLVCLYPNRTPLLIQCKTTKSKSTRRKLVDEFSLRPPLPKSDRYIQVLVLSEPGGWGEFGLP